MKQEDNMFPRNFCNGKPGDLCWFLEVWQKPLTWMMHWVSVFLTTILAGGFNFKVSLHCGYGCEGWNGGQGMHLSRNGQC